MHGYFFALFLLCCASLAAEARTYKTPLGVTCDTVRQYYAQLGGMQGVIAYGKANNIELTPYQKRAALRCLRERSAENK